MNILVTGSNGQLGNEMRRFSRNSSDNYVFTDVAELDITDAEAVTDMVKRMSADIIVNCAAYTNVDCAEDDEQTADKLNNMAVRNLAEAAREVGAVLIHISTDYVFDGQNNVPYAEEHPVAPLGAYGRTKLAGERAIADTGCRHIIIRTSWLYSPFGNNFVKTMRRLTSERDSIKVVFDQVGSPTYAGDLAAFIVQIIAEGKLAREGIYHFSNEGVCSWYDFAKEICALSGNECDIAPCHSNEFPSKVERPHYSVLDKTKVKSVFGIRIPYWKDSLVRCINELNNK